MKARICQFLLYAWFSACFTSASHATPSCEGWLRTSHLAQPTLAKVAEALSKLTTHDQEFFLVSDWGDPREQLVSDGDPYEYKQLLRDSFSAPTPFYNKQNQRSGGLGVFQGHVFPEGYWRFANQPRAIATREQPWLEWDKTKSTYTIRRGGTAQALLTPYSSHGKVKLYRGAQKQGLDFLKRIASGDLTDLTEDSFGYTDALFFTPDREVASKMWGSDGYAEIQITRDDFDAIYAGIEYHYVEVALSPAVLLKSISSLRVFSR